MGRSARQAEPAQRRRRDGRAHRVAAKTHPYACEQMLRRTWSRQTIRGAGMLDNKWITAECRRSAWLGLFVLASFSLGCGGDDDAGKDAGAAPSDDGGSATLDAGPGRRFAVATATLLPRRQSVRALRTLGSAGRRALNGRCVAGRLVRPARTHSATRYQSAGHHGRDAQRPCHRSLRGIVGEQPS